MEALYDEPDELYLLTMQAFFFFYLPQHVTDVSLKKMCSVNQFIYLFPYLLNQAFII